MREHRRDKGPLDVTSHLGNRAAPPREALYRATGAAGFEPFAAAVDRYVAFHWTHMHKEEDVVLPLASKVLTEADWRTIGEAFSDNADLVFGGTPQYAFEELFHLIVRLAPRRSGWDRPERNHQVHGERLVGPRDRYRASNR